MLNQFPVLFQKITSRQLIRKVILFIPLMLMFSSCKSNEINELNKRVTELESECEAKDEQINLLNDAQIDMDEISSYKNRISELETEVEQFS